jgi:UPF0755 protein
MRKKRNILSSFIVVAFLGGLCLASLFGASWAASLPTRSAALFGSPRPGLGSVQTIQLSYRLLQNQAELLTPAQPGGEPIDFEIPDGESSGAVMARLEVAGLIRDSEAMIDYLIYTGLDTRILQGSYTLSPRVPPIQVVGAVVDPSATNVPFIVLAGWRIEEISAALPTSGLNITGEDLLNEAWNRPEGFAFVELIPYTQNYTVEGYLLPDQYNISRNTTARELIHVLLRNFSASVTPEIVQGFAANNLSLHGGITLASIVEREAHLDEEKALIAGVYLNRLAVGMNLAADPTVQYAIGFNSVQNTWWTNPLSLADLKAVSPYNTYVNNGLPPGPIANPDLSTINAAAFPEDSPYYFFRSNCDGSGRHVFAVTFEDHLANGCE